MADGFVQPASILQQVAEVPMRLGEIRLQTDRVTECVSASAVRSASCSALASPKWTAGSSGSPAERTVLSIDFRRAPGPSSASARLVWRLSDRDQTHLLLVPCDGVHQPAFSSRMSSRVRTSAGPDRVEVPPGLLDGFVWLPERSSATPRFSGSTDGGDREGLPIVIDGLGFMTGRREHVRQVV